jgi:hypothetical protein
MSSPALWSLLTTPSRWQYIAAVRPISIARSAIAGCGGGGGGGGRRGAMLECRRAREIDITWSRLRSVVERRILV